ncbi:MAG: succinate dehydrogenase, cytochrome b556 subunit [Gammaproteobacteria bacterium]|nr:succinate dehydrogenase, cytochrome b556 subunit [Gammaproteobacteria bacterium]MDE2345693.1 succinate dehydrogenase, cytochrome b556 subunit [Gammaproteobacteria bacterium]
MAADNRPTSPHIGIYRWQISMVMSILHRLTGVWLSLGALALVYWLIAAGFGPDAYASAQVLFASWLGQLLMWSWCFSLFYHLCNGIRHLFWDAGKGFEIRSMYISGFSVWIISGLMTLLAILFVYQHGGGT